ncbi:type II toxin-antitoxin system PemK/MazF family toxin [Protaetiibacter larvae]|uniref:mRNA interferase n=1 Tax=Protaetiibacter larvae TaxID=2592654 RepID=A0A5C1YBH9_9MICO|nr:type II toxin-antitoxin system PemK/MazF family toxin [Protaetiibacter larvae]QEO10489.1 type II toxin-antitoxin system PemK/MazF family toxin [Protaetiibacter larvae]
MTDGLVVRRGAVVLVLLDPAVGSEQGKTRPAVVVSTDAANAAALFHQRGVVTVVPVTSNVERILPIHVLLPRADTGLPIESKAQPEQVRAVDVTRVVRSFNVLRGETMAAVDEALRLHLGL